MTDDQRDQEPYTEKGLSEAYAEERRRARLVLAARAQNAEDLSFLLEILDLRPQRERPARDREQRRGEGGESP